MKAHTRPSSPNTNTHPKTHRPAAQDPSGDLVTDHKKIAANYLRGWFIVDLLATFPADYIVRGVEARRSLCSVGWGWLGGDACR